MQGEKQFCLSDLWFHEQKNLEVVLTLPIATSKYTKLSNAT